MRKHGDSELDHLIKEIQADGQDIGQVSAFIGNLRFETDSSSEADGYVNHLKGKR